MKNANDTKAMMQLFAQNPQKGFEQIYTAFSGPIFRYLKSSFSLSREEAEDILQNIFLPWVREPQKFANIENPSAYLFASARNSAYKFKSDFMQPSKELENFNPGNCENIEAGLMIENALSELPIEQKEAVVLKIWTDMTFGEIAQLQQCSLQTVASRYRYAIARLKELIPWEK